MLTLIADSGSTKTEWRLVEAADVVRVGRTTGFNPYYQDTEAITEGLQHQLVPILGSLMPDNVFFYGAGCANPEANTRVADAIRAVFPAVKHVAIQSDMVGAARAACQQAPGLVCILGTGSNVARYDGQTITSPSRSLGFWLGDEGSGGHLGKLLVINFLQGQLPPDLHQAFQQHYALDRLTVLENAYHRPFPNRYFAQFTPFLAQYSGQPFVDGLVTAAFVSFLNLYVKPLVNHPGESVHFVGSVAYYFEPFLRQAVQAGPLTMGQLVPAPIDELVRFHQTH